MIFASDDGHKEVFPDVPMIGFKIQYNCNSKMAVCLIECEICGEQYTGSTKTKFRLRANTYKSRQRKFVNKETFPKQALKHKRSHEHYCSDRHNGIEDWVITLIDSAIIVQIDIMAQRIGLLL